MHAAVELFDALARDYDEHFAVPHRRAYDDLAWELTTQVLCPPPAVVLDVGCGVGRWAARLLSAGYEVIGVEPSAAMAEEAERRIQDPAFRLVRGSVEEVEFAPGSVDCVLAMGSLQYAEDPTQALALIARWVRPEGRVCVLVDSLVALVIELLRDGKDVEAAERLATGRGLWSQRGRAAELTLFNAATLAEACSAAGLDVQRCAGLLVGASVFGREGLTELLAASYDEALARERAFANQPQLADLGKQLFAVARRQCR